MNGQGKNEDRTYGLRIMRTRSPWYLFGIRLPAFTEGSFAYNTTFTSGRSLVTILAQFIFTPIIVNIYDPVAYGAFGFIFSISTLLLTFSTLQYQKAFLIASDETDINDLQSLNNTLSLLFALLVFGIMLLMHDMIMRNEQVKAFGRGIYLIPVFILLGAWSQTSQGLVAVRYRYKQGFLYGSFMVIGSKLTAIGYGLLIGNGYMGLVFAELFNRSFQQLLNYKVILDQPLKFSSFIKLRGNGRVFRKFIGFPKYELPAMALAALSNQIPVFWIPGSFGIATFGQFTLAMSLLEMPMRFFGYSLSETFYQKASKTYREQGRHQLSLITFKMVGTIGVLSLLPLAFITVFSEKVFVWIFGQEWALAGHIASIFSVYYFFRLLSEPVSSVLRVIGEQKTYLYFNGSFFLLRLTAVTLAVLGSMSVRQSMTTYALLNACGYLFLLLHILHRLSLHKGSGTKDVLPRQDRNEQ